MHLHLDATDRSNPFIQLDGKTFPAQDGLLLAIDAALKEQGADKKQITKVTVNRGPGSFTGLRVSIAIANALGYSLEILKIGDLITPDYGQEPNISQIKKI